MVYDMDSALAHSFPGYSQPEHHLNHILQFHPHLQLVDDSNRFASNSSSSVSLTSMFPMPGGGSCNNNFQYSHPPPPLLPLSRRGSDCSVLSNASSDGDGGVLMMVESRSRLTREQIQLLERQFSDSPKPSTKLRRALADKTGLSVQRVGNWFQNRRAKAKQQKRQEEMQTRQILASAGRRRATEPSSPVSSSPLLLPTGATTASSGTTFPADNMMTAPKPPRRAKSFADIPSTPARFAKKHGESVSPYSSPSEASYASLARSLAVATAAAAHADSVGGFQVNSHEIPNQSHPQSQLPGYTHPFTLGGTESPWPISRFSDYGSSTASSIIYTPTPAGQLEDPFEYDQISPDSDYHYDDGGDSQSNNNPAEPVDYFDYHYPQEDFSAFAAAIDVTSTQRTFVLPAMPPTRFLRSPRAGDGQGSQSHRNHNLDQQQQQREASERDFIRRDSCPGEFLDAFSSIDLPEQARNELPGTEDELTPEAEPSYQQSLANRRKAPTPMPLGTASLRSSFFLTQPTAPPHSSTLPSSSLSLPATSMRRIKSTSATTTALPRFSPPSSPPITAVQAKSFNGLLLDGLDRDMEEVGPTATIRPRTAGCSATTGKAFSLANLFKVEAPPTPVSPADASAASSSSSSPPTTNKVGVEMSPPATPANQQCTSDTNIATTPSEANFETAQYRICTAPRPQSSGVPRTGGGDFCYGDADGMVGFVGFGGGGGEAFDAFATAVEAGGKEEEAFPFERYLATARSGSGEGIF